MDKYFNSYRKMLSLHGLTDHTTQSYSTYIKAVRKSKNIHMKKALDELLKLDS